ncbi:Uncharacterised protein [uncultured archaeon]|nr:Uncharacterised protein [uncultured archaeon]
MSPSICKSEILPEFGIIAIGMSTASGASSSSFVRSTTILPFARPTATADTMSLIGIPASASATAAAVSAVTLVPASACTISISILIMVFGSSSTKIAGSSASFMTFEISIERLSYPGFFLSPTEKGIMLYLHMMTAFWGSSRCLG